VAIAGGRNAFCIPKDVKIGHDPALIPRVVRLLQPLPPPPAPSLPAPEEQPQAPKPVKECTACENRLDSAKRTIAQLERGIFPLRFAPPQPSPGLPDEQPEPPDREPPVPGVAAFQRMERAAYAPDPLGEPTRADGPPPPPPPPVVDEVNFAYVTNLGTLLDIMA